MATDTLPVIVIPSMFPLLPLVRYLLPLTTLNRYLSRDSNGNLFYCHIKEYICCKIWTDSSNYTTFGFSLDSLNSAKGI